MTSDSKSFIIRRVVAEELKVNVSQILSPSRLAVYVKARMIICHLLRYNTDLTLMRIAKIIGRKDHTTIIHHIQEFDKHTKDNKDGTEFNRLVNMIDRKILDEMRIVELERLLMEAQ